MMDQWMFASPLWLLLALVLPVVAWLRSRRGHRVFVVPHVSHWWGRDPVPRSRIPAVLALAGLLLLVVAMARPQKVEERRQVRGEGYDIVLAIDLSGSMLAEDYQAEGKSAESPPGHETRHRSLHESQRARPDRRGDVRRPGLHPGSAQLRPPLAPNADRTPSGRTGRGRDGGWRCALARGVATGTARENGRRRAQGWLRDLADGWSEQRGNHRSPQGPRTSQRLGVSRSTRSAPAATVL